MRLAPQARRVRPAPRVQVPSAATQTYRLIANPSALVPLVGKKLELTGTIEQENASPATSDPSVAPALRVKSGKIVAASCSE